MGPDTYESIRTALYCTYAVHDEEIVEIEKKISALVEKMEGKIVSSTNLGKIRLAYPIKKIRHGTYVLVYFDAQGDKLKELNRQLSLTDEVLRHTIIDRAEDADPSKFELTSYVAPLSEEAKAQRREKSRSEKERPRKPRPPAPEPVKAIVPPAPSTTSTEESKMSLEELDKKLDEILEGDIAENI